MVGQASSNCANGCCNARSKSDQEPPIPDLSKVRESPDPCQGCALSFVIKSSPANPIVSFLDLLLHARVKVISQ